NTEERSRRAARRKRRCYRQCLQVQTLSPHLFVYRRCDERIAWSRPGPRAYSVQQPCTKDALPSRRNTHQRLGYCRREITSQRYTFPFLQPVGKCAGEALHNILRSLGKTLYQPNDTAARSQRSSQKYRQHRIEHFRRGVSKETRRGARNEFLESPAKYCFMLR